MIRNALLVIASIAFLFAMANRHNFNHSHHSSAMHGGRTTNGLMMMTMEQVFSVVIKNQDTIWRLEKESAGWVFKEGRLSGPALDILGDFLSMLANSEPVRTFLPEDLLTSTSKDYGLKTPVLEVSIERHDAARPIVTPNSRVGGATNIEEQTNSIYFGNATPDGSLYYTRVKGDPNLYVMSGFLFEQAGKLIEALQAGVEN